MNMANGKGETMPKNTKTATTKSNEWLTATMRNGRRRIETLGWKRLAGIYAANRPARASQRSILRSRAAAPVLRSSATAKDEKDESAASQSSSSKIRKAINAEARRCGYTPRTVLALNAE